MNKIMFKNLKGLVLIDANVDGETGFLIFDTGSIKSTMNLKYFRKKANKIESQKFTVIKDKETITDEKEHGFLKINIINLGGYHIDDVETQLIDLSYVENPLNAIEDGIKVLGTIGLDIISKHKITINYKENFLIFNDSTATNTTANFVRDSKGLIISKIYIDGKILNMVIDTGATISTITEKNKPIMIERAISEKIFLSKKFCLLDNEFNNISFLALGINSLSSNIDIDGIIGANVFTNLIISFDFQTSTIQMIKS